MKIVSYTVTLFVFSVWLSPSLLGQGFDWQYSARMPTEYPRLFVGGYGAFLQTLHSSSLRYKEERNGVACDCGAIFSGTRSFDFVGGLTFEYWLSETNIAIIGGIFLEQRNATFEAEGRKLPVNPFVFPMLDTFFLSTYTLQTQTINAGMEVGIKYKITPLPVFLAAALQASAVVQQQLYLEERSPNFEYFASNLPTTFVKFQPILMSVKAAVGADVPLARSLYLSPAIFIEMPLSTLLQENSQWLRFSYGIQISLLYSFAP